MDNLQQFYARVLSDGVEGMLASLGESFGAIALGITTRASLGAVTQRWLGLDPAFESAYLAGFCDKDVFLQGAARVGLGVGRCAAGHDLVDDAVRGQSALIHELFRPFGFGDLLGGVLSSRASGMMSFGLIRPWDATRFTREDAALLEGWFPHIQNALGIVGVPTATAGAWVSSVGRMLEVRGDDAALWRTLSVVRGELHARDPRLQCALSRAIGRAALTGVPTTLRAPGALLRVTPYVLGGAWVEAYALGSALAGGVERVRELFGLSPAEAALACAIADGDEPSCFAARRGVRISTVRTQLRAVFRKAGVTKQTELAALVTACLRLPR